MTLVDDVTGLFFGEILFFIGWTVWTLLDVSRLDTLVTEKANLNFERDFATAKA